MTQKIMWKIELQTANDLSISFSDGIPTQSSEMVTFESIEATEEEMNKIIDDAIDAKRGIDIKFPEGYRLLRYFIPYDNLLSLSAFKETDEEPNLNVILDEVEKILNKEDKDETTN